MANRRDDYYRLRMAVGFLTIFGAAADVVARAVQVSSYESPTWLTPVIVIVAGALFTKELWDRGNK